uniref:F317L homolog protein n=1 Tax=Abalone asfa-like virus TaxID=2839893 RepID=A0A5K7Y3E1_9VIRU|nr:F317L homolog protein [Abalone asfa-like virus]BCY04533.1 hypothetical protein [Abalone asfa-like virus]
MQIENLIKIVLIILFVIIGVLILCLLIRSQKNMFGGGEEPEIPVLIDPHKCKQSKTKADFYLEALKTQPFNNFNIKIDGGGGAIKKKSKKEFWWQAKTWDEIYRDQGLTQQFFKDRFDFFTKLLVDWSGIHKRMDISSADREWAGAIQIIDHKAIMDNLVPSPWEIGSSSTPSNASAAVPGYVCSVIERKPALIYFHTHPGTNIMSIIPSPMDIYGSLLSRLHGIGMADAIISDYGVVVYGIRPDTFLWLHHKPRNFKLRWLTNVILTYITANSYHRSFMSVKKLLKSLHEFGIYIYVFPKTEECYTLFMRTFFPGFRGGLESTIDYAEKYLDLVDEEI